jgi:hypothetical protein
MISNYLNLVFTNCKLLKRTSSFNDKATTLFFENQIKKDLIDINLSSELELFNFLISKPYHQLTAVFSKSKHLQIFYLINSLNEYNAPKEDYDSLGRYQYDSSIMKELGIKNNIVLDLIKNCVLGNEFLKSIFTISNHNSYFYLSHDIDSIYGSLTQDGMWAIKNKRPDVMWKLFFNLVMSKPHWLNFDLIMKTESEYDFKSTFYWLVNKGKIDARQTNSDYSISSSKVISEINDISKNGFEVGLHKSISNESFKSEMAKMSISVHGNRFHYLKFQLPDAYNKIEEAGLKLDASLGFAEHYGFRNGYGYPFQPFNSNTNKPYSFVEVPLNIMDGTFQRYMQIPVEKTADTIISFLETHNQNALLSILWHNTFFSNYKYKGYLNEYKKILAYLYEAKFQNINQNEIINQFSWQKK